MEATLLTEAQAHNAKILDEFFSMDGEDTGKVNVKFLNDVFGYVLKSEEFNELCDPYRSDLIFQYQRLCELFLDLKDPRQVCDR